MYFLNRPAEVFKTYKTQTHVIHCKPSNCCVVVVRGCTALFIKPAQIACSCFQLQGEVAPTCFATLLSTFANDHI